MLLTPTAFVLLASLEQRVGREQEVFSRLPGTCIPDTALPTKCHKILVDGCDRVDVGIQDFLCTSNGSYNDIAPSAVSVAPTPSVLTGC